MNKELVIEIVSIRLKLIRVEQEYTQDEMARILGVSKKTLLQIEKGRMPASWTLAVAVCALFRESNVLQSVLGNDPVEIVEMVAHKKIRRSIDKTLGGRVWWRELMNQNGYQLQQNIISNHYRILDQKNYRLFSTIDKEEASIEFNNIIENE